MNWDEVDLCEHQALVVLLIYRAAAQFALKRAGNVAAVQLVGLETPCTISVRPSINLALPWGGGVARDAAANLDIVKGDYSNKQHEEASLLNLVVKESSFRVLVTICIVWKHKIQNPQFAEYPTGPLLADKSEISHQL